MFGNNNILALDIGSRLIKTVYAKGGKRGISVLNAGICETPRGSFLDGSISDKSSIASAVRDMISSLNIKPKSVIIGIKGQDIIMRQIEMPPMPAKQLRQAVKLEIQQYLPMDPNEYIIDSKIIDKIDSKDKKAYNVLLVAAPKEKVNDYIYIAERLELKVLAVDLFANSVVRLFGDANDSGGKTFCVIDMGFSSSTVTIIESGKLFIEKEVDIGIGGIDAMLEKVFANTIENVGDVRKRIIRLNSFDMAGSDDPRVYYANNSARQIIDKLIDNVEKIINFYFTSGLGKRIDCIYLYGGGSRLNGITDYMGTATNTDTRHLSWDMVGNVGNAGDDLKRNADLYANAISLLLRKE